MLELKLRLNAIKVIYPVRAANNKTESLASVKKRLPAGTLLINGGYYNMSTGAPESWLVINGKVLANKYNGYGYSTDGNKIKWDYANQNTKYPNFIGGVFRLLENSQIAMIGGQADKRGRTAMGLSNSDLIVRVSKDNISSEKITSFQLADRMQKLGCVTAIELDGGGSSQYRGMYEEYSSGRAVSWWTAIELTDEYIYSEIKKSNVVVREKSKNFFVGILQEKLKLDYDESFGPATKKTVLSYQKANGLAQDGVVGPATWKMIFEGKQSVAVCPCCGQEIR